VVSQPKLIIKLFVFRNIFSHGQSTRTHTHDLQRKDIHLLFRGWLVEYPKSRKKGLGRKNCTSSVYGGGRRLRLTYAEEVTRPLCPSLSDKEAGTYSQYNIRFIDSTCLVTCKLPFRTLLYNHKQPTVLLYTRVTWQKHVSTIPITLLLVLNYFRSIVYYPDSKFLAIIDLVAFYLNITFVGQIPSKSNVIALVSNLSNVLSYSGQISQQLIGSWYRPLPVTEAKSYRKFAEFT
jgi:general stress protein CsbA